MCVYLGHVLSADHHNVAYVRSGVIRLRWRHWSQMKNLTVRLFNVDAKNFLTLHPGLVSPPRSYLEVTFPIRTNVVEPRKNWPNAHFVPISTVDIELILMGRSAHSVHPGFFCILHNLRALYRPLPN